MAQVKGTAVRGVLKYVKESGFAGGIPAVIAQLPDRSREVFGQRVLSSSWVPYAAYADLLVAVDRTFSHGDQSLMHPLGRWLGEQDLGTTFKIVALFASVETVLQRSMLFWGRHCDVGTFETLEATHGRAVGAIKEIPDIHPMHCRLVAGWIEGIGAGAGGHEVAVRHDRCVHRGHPWCEYTGTWE